MDLEIIPYLISCYFHQKECCAGLRCDLDLQHGLIGDQCHNSKELMGIVAPIF